MFKRFLAAGLVAVVTFAVAVVAEARTIHFNNVMGRMPPVAQGGSEHGAFRMKVRDVGGNHAEQIEAIARGLNTTGASRQNPPNFHVFLVKSDGSAAADFGAMRVNLHGNGSFLFDSRHMSYPSGVTTIVDYVGGKIEVRDASGTAVCSGTVPAFDYVVGDAASRLQPVSSSVSGGGAIGVHRMATPNATREQLAIACRGLTANTAYTAVAIAADTTETQIGTFTTNRRGMGGLRLQDSAIPGGGLMGLAGQTVEIRDASGAVLTGTFPTISQ
jgi:hypothetical protein